MYHYKPYVAPICTGRLCRHIGCPPFSTGKLCRHNTFNLLNKQSLVAQEDYADIIGLV